MAPVDGKDHLTDEGKKHDADRDAYLLATRLNRTVCPSRRR